jgi:hypothetical protein
MPIFRLEVSRTTAESAWVYVLADSEDDARDKTHEDIDDIVDSYSDWDVDGVLSDSTEIDKIVEVDELPKDYEIPEELDFREPVPEEERPEPVDPRQMKLPV